MEPKCALSRIENVTFTVFMSKRHWYLRDNDFGNNYRYTVDVSPRMELKRLYV